ncbi:MAG TPA: acetylglutamate kinase [Sphingobacterium sp.]|nr:acetylglutamate kinase [Sphingobacterium sp.]
MTENSLLQVIKIGGNIIDDPEALDDFLEKFSALRGKKILVHGGGKEATRVAVKMGVQTKMIDGRRITDKEMLDIVTMVYAGKINKEIVVRLQKMHTEALGLTGADVNTIQTVKRPVKDIDYGYVGDVLHDSVNVLNIKKILDAGFIPVFSAITHNGNGKLLNTNADTVAAALASAFSSTYDVSLVYSFEKNGVLSDINDEDSIIEQIDKEQYEAFKNEGVVNQGMIPKLDNAFEALMKGVSRVYIGNARNLQLLQQDAFGTKLII